MTQVKEYSTEEVVTVPVDASIDDAIQLLKQNDFRHLPVARDGLLVGMVSVGDIFETVGGLLSEQRASTQDATVAYAGPTAVEEIMKTDVVTLSPEEPVATAARLMLERQIGAVILVANERIVGIVTETDYMRRFSDHCSVDPDACCRQPVANHLSTELITASPKDDVFTLIRKMRKQIHHLPVLESGRLVGIVSDHDVRRAMALDKIEQITDPDQRIRLMANFDAGRIMSKQIESTTPTATLADAARQMIERRVGALPVIEAGSFAGIITKSDILHASATALGESA